MSAPVFKSLHRGAIININSGYTPTKTAKLHSHTVSAFEPLTFSNTKEHMKEE